MAIRGDLLSVDLSNVFQMLALNRKRGILHLNNHENILQKRSLILAEDRVAVMHVPQVDDLTGLLVDLGTLTYEEYRAVEEKSRRFGISRGDLLAKRGFVQEADLREARKRLQEELILEIFLWRQVGFALDEDMPVHDCPDRDYFVVDLMVMEAARRQDEWKRVVDRMGGGGDIWARIPSVPAPTDVSAVDRIVLDHIDGIRGTPQIMAATGLPRYHVDLAICCLLDRDCVRRMELDDLIETGDELLRGERVDEAIRLFRCALRYDRKSLAIHKRLATAYLEQQRVAKAAAHYKFCAMTLLESHLVREALTIYQYVVAILPTDFRALERVLDLLGRTSDTLTADDRKCVDQGVKLFNFYYDAKLLEDAERVLRLLIAIMPDDMGLGFSLARIYSKTGRINDAVEAYMGLAGQLCEVRDYDAALNVYKTVVSFDSASKEICQRRIAQIRDIIAQKRRRRVAAGTLAFAVFLFVGVGIGYLFYHTLAKTELERVSAKEGQIVDEAGWKALAAEYDDLAARFPVSPGGREARQRQRLVEGRLQRYERVRQEQADDVNRTRADAFVRGRRAYEEAWSRHTNRDFKGAVELYAECLVLLAEAGRSEWGDDPAREIPKCIARLQSMIEREGAALARVRGLESERRWPEVFAASRRLRDASDQGEPTSYQTIEQLRFPILVRTAPADAVISLTDGSALDEGQHVVLSHDRPRAVVHVEREGHRPREVELEWVTPSYECLIVLEKEPQSRAEAGDRVHQILPHGSGFALLCANGSVYTHSATGERREAYRPTAFLTVSASGVLRSGHVIYGTASGRLRAVDLERGTLTWRWGPAGARVTGVCLVRDLIAASVEGEVGLLIVDPDRGNTVRTIALPSPPAGMVSAGTRVAIVGSDGALSLVDPASGGVIPVGGTFLTRLAATADRLYAIDADGRARGRPARTGRDGASRVGQSGPFPVGPANAGDRIVFVRGDGRLLVVERDGSHRVTDVVVAGTPSGLPLVDLGRNETLVPIEKGVAVHVDLDRGRAIGAYRGGGAPFTAVRAGGRLWVAYSNVAGVLEAY